MDDFDLRAMRAELDSFMASHLVLRATIAEMLRQYPTNLAAVRAMVAHMPPELRAAANTTLSGIEANASD